MFSEANQMKRKMKTGTRFATTKKEREGWVVALAESFA